MKFSISSLLLHLKSKNDLQTQLNEKGFVDTLNNLGLEVEEFFAKKSYQNIIIGQIKSFHKHPNADKLNVCNVFDGEEDKQIVCGAKNVKTGMKVALAKIGAIIPNGNFTIQRSKIRDVESYGMMCSISELLISKENNIGYIANIEEEGIVEFSEDVAVGDGIEKYISNESKFELKITPDRGYATGLFGIAKDLQALGLSDVYSVSDFTDNLSKKYNLQKENCDISKNIYCEKKTNMIQDVASGANLNLIKINNIDNSISSPAWLVSGLMEFGLSSINLTVDILNFLMMHFGFPMHAFDADNVHLPISLKKTKQIFSFVTLKDELLEIPKDSLIVADAKDSILSLAGVIGGASAKITKETKNIIIECGFFPKDIISKTLSLTKIKTDAGYRFERGVNLEIAEDLIKCASKLIIMLCGGCVEGSDFHSSKFEKKCIALRLDRISQILGFCIEKKDVIKILENLDFEVLNKDNEILQILIPFFRSEIEFENEVITEIGRIIGYSNLPKKDSFEVGILNIHNCAVNKFDLIEKIKNILSINFNECISLPFVQGSHFDLFQTDFHLKNELFIQNAINSSFDHLRNNLLIGLLEKVSYNLKNYKLSEMSLFEIGKVFFGKEVQEDYVAGIFLESRKSREEDSFYYLKSKIFKLLGSFTDTDFMLQEVKINYCHPNKCYSICDANGVVLGEMGLLHPKALKAFDIEKDVWFFNISVEKISNTLKKINFNYFDQEDYKDFTTREFSILVEKDTVCEQIIKSILLVKNVKFAEILDVYQSLQESGLQNQKSVSILVGIKKDDSREKDGQNNIDFVFREAINATLLNGAILRDGVSAK